MKQIKYLVQWLSMFVVLGISPMAWGGASNCQFMVISGDAQWPPFSFIQNDQLKGAGVSLTRFMADELLLPYEIKTIQREDDLLSLLKQGRVDIAVGTFDIRRYREVAHIVYPGYFDENLSVITRSSHYFENSQWFDLMGRVGLASDHAQLGDNFSRFAKHYLFVKKNGNLRSLYRRIKNGEGDYVIGSTEYLWVGMDKYGQESDLEFLPVHMDELPMHVAVSKASKCAQYVPFFRARIQQLKKDGVIQKWVDHYANRAPSVEDASQLTNPFASEGKGGSYMPLMK